MTNEVRSFKTETAGGEPRFRVMTAMAPGAIAIVQVWGADLAGLLNRLTAGAVPARWGLMELRLTATDSAAEVGDEAVVAWLGERWCQIMPHGGVRVVQRLIDRLRAAGAVDADADADERDAWSLYPEAATAIEADMLAALSRAASPAAVDLLIDQPRRWAEAATAGTLDPAAIARRSVVLDRLIDPPTVVVTGPANVGKSTLTNRLSGRSASLTADLPGTTRDWVSALVMLAADAGPGEVAVRWLDTPGVRETADAIEQRAIELARSVMATADLVIAMREPGGNWPATQALGRPADLRVLNKIDRIDATGDNDPADADVRISATTGQGLDALAAAVLERLGLAAAINGEALWAFSTPLKRMIAAANAGRTEQAMRALAEYAGR